MVKQVLSEKGITQKELAEKLNMKPGSLSRALNNNPTLNTMQKVSEALNIDISKLFNTNKPYGFIEYNGKIHKINSLLDLELLIDVVKN